MKDTIYTMIEQAEALLGKLKTVGKKLSSYEGEQLTEAKTEQQLDRWTQERGLDESVETAITHMTKVLDELRWIYGGIER